MAAIVVQISKHLEKIKVNENNSTKVHHDSPHLPAPSCSDRIEMQLRIPDQQMAKQIMDRTIALLQKTALETSNPNEKAQALQCIQLIRRDNPQLVALGKPVNSVF